MVASLCFSDPKFAERTLLILGTFHKLLKGLFRLIGVSCRLIFFAGETSVEKNSTLQAIPFFAWDTSKIVAIYSIFINECVGAICGRAPWNIVLNSNSLKECVLLIFFHILRWKDCVHVSRSKVYLTVWQRTFNWTLRNFNLWLKIAPYTFFMKDMLTIRKHAEIFF